MIKGLKMLHDEGVIHQDYHSGNIFNAGNKGASAITGDFGISKSAIETSDDDNEVYGIIPRPFWDRSHDTELIIEICDGLRPPIVTNAPEGYIELMQKCWHSDPNERQSASDVLKEFNYPNNLGRYDGYNNQTKIISSPDIGPVTTNNPGAIYKSRPLSTMIKSANFTRSLRLKSLVFDKRKFNNNLIENNNNNKDKIHKRLKYCEEQNDDYLTQELEFDINCNTNSNKSEDNDYITSELNFDI
ncbi:kinase-like domain-containing protein [Rhizophagus irregularis DAOM 181602=DAOM 197198]|nr:kinase-like domain-containing protein [Rhizophagus irregularis DAOM 181602=DAOM 197198]